MPKDTHEVRDIPGGIAVIGFFLSFLSGGALMWGYDTHRIESLHGPGAEDTAATDTAPWSDSDSPIPVDSKDPMWGNRLAPVTIVEFSDFQCPYCGRVEPAVEQIKQNYGPDKVRILWKHLPLSNHPNARPAAEAAAGVFALKGNAAFWKFHDLAFRNQGSLSPENYERWAQQAGVTELGKFKAGLASHKWASKVEQDEALSRQINIDGTPAFFINGAPISGAQPYDKFKALIDQELGKAQAKIAAGTPKSEVYVRASKEAKIATKPPPAEAKDDGLWKVPIGKSPVLGSDKALVTVVAFSDFECVFCKRSEGIMKQVRDTYGDKVRVVWKNQPITSMHKHAEAAAQFALAARAEKGDKGFWDAHDKLFESAPKLEDEDFARIAKELGLSADKVQGAIKEHKYKKEIDADQEMAEEFAATSTPHYFINGRRVAGALPFDNFKKVIDEEIAKSTALLAKGTKPGDLYDTLVKDGKGAPELEKRTLAARLNAPVKGNPNAKVTIVEVSDFQCPFCRRAEDTLKEVMKNYGDRVKLTWRHFPLTIHDDAGLAAQASQEAFKQKGADGFWKMHDMLFANQQTENGFKREAIETYAAKSGLDLAKFKTALDQQTHRPIIDEDVKAVSDAGINATPGFLINGYYISGAEPYAKFRKVIERALAESK